MLSIDFWNILYTVINLLVFFLIIKFFLLKPVKKVMDQREQMIKDDLDNAARTKKEAEEIKAEYEGNIKSARDEATQITEDAKKSAAAQKEKILTSANKEASTIIDKAQKNAQLEYEKKMSQLESEIADLALVAAEKVVKESAVSDDTSAFDKFLSEEDK